MRLTLLVVALLLCGAGGAEAQRQPDLAPAEPVPTDFAGNEWRDSRGCVFVRATVAGAVTWLPLLDAERRLVCAAPGLAEVPAPPAPVDEARAPAPADAAEADALESAPQIAEAAEVLRRAARIAAGGAETLANAPPAFQAPTTAEAPAPPVPTAPAAPADDALRSLARLAEETDAPRARLIFVEPDDRVRIVHVDRPSVLRGNPDPFGMELPLAGVAGHAPRRGALVGYHPAPARLAVAPPIRGFGPDPAPIPRVRRGHAPAG